MAVFTAQDKDIINRSNPSLEAMSLGTAIYKADMCIFTYEVEADGRAGLKMLTAPFDFKIVNIYVQGTTSDALKATVDLEGDDIHTEIDSANGTLVQMTAGIDKDKLEVEAGEDLTVTTDHADARGFITILGVRR